ncbi:MAG: EamA family transporter [bacterium]
MLYLSIAVVGYIALAIVNIFDKFILTKAVPKPSVFVFYSTALVLPILLLVPFGAGFLSGSFDWIMAMIAGLFFVLALWAMYIGFQQSEVSHAGPLLGAGTAVFVLILGQIFLKEVLSAYQIIGILILIFGCLLISFEHSKKHNGLHMGMLWILLAGLCFAISHVASKYIYDVYEFFTGLVWTRGFMGVFGALLLFSPQVRKIFTGRPKKTNNSNLKQLVLVFSSRSLAILAVILIQYSIAVGSVTIVNALAGVQFAVLIIIIALLSKFAPRLFKENFVRGELIWELVSVLVIAVGLVLVIL